MRPLPLVLALALASPLPARAFDLRLVEHATVADAGGGDTVAMPSCLQLATLVGLGTLASGAILAGSLALPGGSGLFFVPVLDVVAIVGLSHLAGLPVSWGAAVLGTVTAGVLAFGAGFAGAAVGRATEQGGGFADIGGMLLGLFLGGTLGPPLAALLWRQANPFGWESDGAVDVAAAARPARRPEA
jgi:hypothetical protein